MTHAGESSGEEKKCPDRRRSSFEKRLKRKNARVKKVTKGKRHLGDGLTLFVHTDRPGGAFEGIR